MFEDNTVEITAKWSFLKQLHELDSTISVPKSMLTVISLFPETTVCQEVSTCLRVLCGATFHALINHPGMREIIT